MPQLIFSLDQEYPLVSNLEADTISIGRSQDNDIVLNEASVAPVHAELRKEEFGFYRLENLSIFVVTVVNKTPIDRNIALKHGDKIKFGNVNALFYDQQESNSNGNKPKGLKGIIQKTDVVQNNLRLLEKDSEWLREEIKRSLEEKDALEEQRDNLSKELEKSKADLNRDKLEVEKLASVMKEANDYKEKSRDLDEALQSKKQTFDEFAQKLVTAERAYADLDLENSIKKKQQLTEEFTQLSEGIEKTKVELEKNKLAAEESAAVVKKLEPLVTETQELAKTFENQKNENNALAAEIKERTKHLEDLATKIAQRNKVLEEQSASLETKQQESKSLEQIIAKNLNLIASANEQLAEVEAKTQKELEVVSQSQTKQQSLKNESIALSRVLAGKMSVLERLKAKINRGAAGVVCPPLRLIDPNLGSLMQYFHHGAGKPAEYRFEPAGFHAFAACTKGSLHRDADSIMSVADPALLLLTGDIDKDLSLIESATVGITGRILLVTWAEGRFQAFAEKAGANLTQLLTKVSGIVVIDSETTKQINEANLEKPHIHLPIPVPLEYPEWKLLDSSSSRVPGIFICGDGFDPNHWLHRRRVDLLNQLVAQSNVNVSIGSRQPGLIDGLNIPKAQLVQLPEKYSEYVQLLCHHQLVAGFGRTTFGSEIANDAVLARTVFMGGDFDNPNDQLIFPDLCISAENDDHNSALQNAIRLLSDIKMYQETVEHCQCLANPFISFSSVKDRLGEFIASYY